MPTDQSTRTTGTARPLGRRLTGVAVAVAMTATLSGCGTISIGGSGETTASESSTTSGASVEPTTASSTDTASSAPSSTSSPSGSSSSAEPTSQGSVSSDADPSPSSGEETWGSSSAASGSSASRDASPSSGESSREWKGSSSSGSESGSESASESASEESSGSSGQDDGSTPADARGRVVESPGIPHRGEAYRWPSGLVVHVSEGESYFPSLAAAGTEGYSDFMRYEITLTNRSHEAFRLSDLRIGGQSGGDKASPVYDSGNGINSLPASKLEVGQTTSFPVAFGVRDPEDTVLDVVQAFDLSDRVVFLQPAK
ncbi:hypothetical protein SAMN05445756_0405 [Kytococcus aerolatus]|uniref:DUF4352 domain-containing protein n=1 Tax=Kytococcus aerolatus TaxID=592308 RepID=A0A212T5B5_9MICO|nr:hypothetical protein SAMN05445756_0405 [Kytococcus aerolatus]